MNKYWKWIIVAITLVVVVYLVSPGLAKVFNNDQPENTAVAGPAPSKIPVSAVVIEPTAINNQITVTGTITANEDIELRSEVSGIIQSIHFKEGSRVKKGELLVSLDHEELSAELEKLRHTQKLYRDSENRQKQLLEREAISQEEYEQALTELNTVTSDIKVVQSRYNKTKIRAPFDGVIGLRYVSQGSYLTPADPIANLYNINPVKIEFSIPEKYSGKVNVGDEIVFSTEALDTLKRGTIYAIEPRVDNETRTLRMRATSSNNDRKLLPGQFTRIQLIFNTIDKALMVPSQAVVPELGGHKVFVNRNGEAASIPIEIGIRTESEIEVISGLQSRDTVIISGILQIRPGSPVQVTVTN